MVRDLKNTQTSSFDAPGKWLKVRVWIMAVIFVGLLGGVFARAVQLQVRQKEKLRGMAQDQYVREVEIPARRGDIYDRRGVPLAQSVDVDSIWIDPSMLADPRAAAKALGKALGLDGGELFARFQKSRRFAWIKRQVTPAEVARTKALELPGLGFTKEPRRFYPQRELGAHVVGMVGTDGHGLDGIEYAFEDELSGDATTRAGFRDAKGRKLHIGGLEDPSARAGAKVVLTIDRQLQYVTEKALTKAVEDAKGVAGTAVMMDPRTGDILAIANWPRFNPNAPQGTPQGSLRNRAATDTFEPGSTFKAFVAAAAIEEKLVNESTIIDCKKGAWAIGRHVINDDHPRDKIAVKQVLQVSSNIGAAQLGAMLGPDRLQAWYQKFGFGERAGLQLPGEGKGVLPYPRAQISLATQSFGQGLTATAVQLTAAYAALANDGVLMRPHLVDKVIDPDGVVLLENKPTEVRRVVSAKTARSVISMLESVVEKEGTAPRARMDEYRVSGKTGTAQKADPVARGYSDKRIGSFIGVVPAEDPRLVIAVVIDEPKTDVYGGLVAAPAFKEIAAASLAYLSVPPSRTVPTPVSVASAAAPSKASSKVAAKAVEVPEPVVSEVVVGEGTVRVPNLRGIAGREAIAQLLSASLEPRLSGSGRVATQTPPAGTVVDKGTQVVLQLAGGLPNITR